MFFLICVKRTKMLMIMVQKSNSILKIQRASLVCGGDEIQLGGIGIDVIALFLICWIKIILCLVHMIRIGIKKI